MSEQRIARVAEALRHADYMNWSAAAVAEKIDGPIGAIVRDARADVVKEILRHIDRQFPDIFKAEASVAVIRRIVENAEGDQ